MKKEDYVYKDFNIYLEPEKKYGKKKFKTTIK